MDVPNLVFDTPLWLALVTTGVAATEGAVVGRGSERPRYDVVGVFVLAVDPTEHQHLAHEAAGHHCCAHNLAGHKH